MGKSNDASRRQINEAIGQIDAVSAQFPGVIIIHNVKTTAVEYMCRRGLDQLQISLKELQDMGAAYYERYFNPEESKEYVPRIYELLKKNNDDELLTFLQQVKLAGDEGWKWHYSSTKILMRDTDGSPLLIITIAIPVSEEPITVKANRLVEENNFLRRHAARFQLLTRQEKRILKEMALGKTSPEIAKDLFISLHTANTHRRNIRRKLGVGSTYELAEYARAFDLI